MPIGEFPCLEDRGQRRQVQNDRQKHRMCTGSRLCQPGVASTPSPHPDTEPAGEDERRDFKEAVRHQQGHRAEPVLGHDVRESPFIPTERTCPARSIRAMGRKARLREPVG